MNALPFGMHVAQSAATKQASHIKRHRATKDEVDKRRRLSTTSSRT